MLLGLCLIEPEAVQYEPRKETLEFITGKQRRIAELIVGELRSLLEGNSQGK